MIVKAEHEQDEWSSDVQSCKPVMPLTCSDSLMDYTNIYSRSLGQPNNSYSCEFPCWYLCAVIMSYYYVPSVL